MDVLLIINIVVSFSLILGGYYMKYQAPKDKDMKMGVLIGRARLSPDIWKYANITCGKNWLVTGFIYLVLGMPVILLMYNFKGENAAKVLTLAYLIFLITNLIISTNSLIKEMNEKFDENGNPKEQEK